MSNEFLGLRIQARLAGPGLLPRRGCTGAALAGGMGPARVGCPSHTLLPTVSSPGSHPFILNRPSAWTRPVPRSPLLPDAGSSRKPSRAASPWSQWSGPIRASCELSLGDKEGDDLGAGDRRPGEGSPGNPTHPWALCVLLAPVATRPGPWPATPEVRRALGLGQNLRRAEVGGFQSRKGSGPDLGSALQLTGL